MIWINIRWTDQLEINLRWMDNDRFVFCVGVFVGKKNQRFYYNLYSNVAFVFNSRKLSSLAFFFWFEVILIHCKKLYDWVGINNGVNNRRFRGFGHGPCKIFRIPHAFSKILIHFYIWPPKEFSLHNAPSKQNFLFHP